MELQLGCVELPVGFELGWGGLGSTLSWVGSSLGLGWLGFGFG